MKREEGTPQHNLCLNADSDPRDQISKKAHRKWVQINKNLKRIENILCKASQFLIKAVFAIAVLFVLFPPSWLTREVLQVYGRLVFVLTLCIGLFRAIVQEVGIKGFVMMYQKNLSAFFGPPALIKLAVLQHEGDLQGIWWINSFLLVMGLALLVVLIYFIKGISWLICMWADYQNQPYVFLDFWRYDTLPENADFATAIYCEDGTLKWQAPPPKLKKKYHQQVMDVKW